MLAAIRTALKWCVVCALSVCILTFAASNYTPVSISLFPFSYEISVPVFLLALVCFAIGVICGGILSSVQTLRAKAQARRSRKHAQALENELEGLKLEHRPVAPAGTAVAFPAVSSV